MVRQIWAIISVFLATPIEGDSSIYRMGSFATTQVKVWVDLDTKRTSTVYYSVIWLNMNILSLDQCWKSTSVIEKKGKARSLQPLECDEKCNDPLNDFLSTKCSLFSACTVNSDTFLQMKIIKRHTAVI